MAVLDEFREEREAIKNASFQKRLQYFWTYRKLYVIGAVVAIAIIVYMVHGVMTGKEEVLNGVFLNCFTVENDYVNQELKTEFAIEQEIDLEKYNLTFSTDLSYQTGEGHSSENQSANETMSIYANAKTLDFIIGSQEVMLELVEKKYFVDLSDVLSEEKYAEYEPYFIYKEAESGEQIPLLIDVSQSEKLAKAYGNTNEVMALGVVLEAPHGDMTVSFVDYIMEK